MAWRPSECVLEGELDNTQPGWTFGWVRIQGRDEPLKLKLAGNCHPDLAGWKFRIVRIEPIPVWAEELHLELTEEQYAEQARQNANEMDYFMLQVGDAITDTSPENDEPEHPEW